MTGDGARRDQGRLASDQEETVMAARRGAPRWARLWSWLIAAVVWIWVINGTLVLDWPSWSAFVNARALQWESRALNIVFSWWRRQLWRPLQCSSSVSSGEVRLG